MTRPNGLPADVPERFCRSMAGFVFHKALPQRAATFDRPILVSSTCPIGATPLGWGAIRTKAEAVREAIQSPKAGGAP